MFILCERQFFSNQVTFADNLKCTIMTSTNGMSNWSITCKLSFNEAKVVHMD